MVPDTAWRLDTSNGEHPFVYTVVSPNHGVMAKARNF